MRTCSSKAFPFNSLRLPWPRGISQGRQRCFGTGYRGKSLPWWDTLGKRKHFPNTIREKKVILEQRRFQAWMIGESHLGRFQWTTHDLSAIFLCMCLSIRLHPHRLGKRSWWSSWTTQRSSICKGFGGRQDSLLFFPITCICQLVGHY